MGDRFYESQRKSTRAAPSTPRVLKKDIIAEINKLLGTEISGLDKCTIATLNQLLEAIDV